MTKAQMNQPKGDSISFSPIIGIICTAVSISAVFLVAVLVCLLQVDESAFLPSLISFFRRGLLLTVPAISILAFWDRRWPIDFLRSDLTTDRSLVSSPSNNQFRWTLFGGLRSPTLSCVLLATEVIGYTSLCSIMGSSDPGDASQWWSSFNQLMPLVVAALPLIVVVRNEIRDDGFSSEIGLPRPCDPEGRPHEEGELFDGLVGPGKRALVTFLFGEHPHRGWTDENTLLVVVALAHLMVHLTGALTALSLWAASALAPPGESVRDALPSIQWFALALVWAPTLVGDRLALRRTILGLLGSLPHRPTESAWNWAPQTGPALGALKAPPSPPYEGWGATAAAVPAAADDSTGEEARPPEEAAEPDPDPDLPQAAPPEAPAAPVAPPRQAPPDGWSWLSQQLDRYTLGLTVEML
ncbi:hypothetical protein PAPYR_5101 [Paratrimastix pyriformis]|uniref:Uncharacterized protein n=1 Tax=Paratrimastix pyriformis TaxID=342808 RepID=A0ABQ8UNZ4_9EUKA|nr:hypothetical protein PAPYR_5101 [Paratrimastix pyriformis]